MVDRPPVPARRARAIRAACAAGVVALVVLAMATGSWASSMSSTSSSSAASRTGVAGAVVAQPREPVPTLPDPEPSARDADARADQILSGEEYQEQEPNWFERALSWIGDRIQDLLRRLFPESPGVPGAAGGPGTVVAWVVIAVLVLVVIFLVARAWNRRQARDADELGDPVYVSEVEARRSADEWLAHAARHEEADEWKAALRCRYRALIVDLIEHGVVRDLPGRTSGEFRLEVRRRAPVLDADFTSASGLFDAAFYGDVPTGPAESVQFQDAAARIIQQIDRPAEPVGVSATGFVAPGADG